MRQLGRATLFCSFSSAETQWIHLLKILGKLLDNKDYCDSELFDQPLYFCAAYPKFSNWQASSYLNQTTVLSLCHPNLPCIYSHKIFLPLIYSTACSQKPTPSQHMYPMGTYFLNLVTSLVIRSSVAFSIKSKVSRFTLSLLLNCSFVQFCYPCCHHGKSLCSTGPFRFLFFVDVQTIAAVMF